ncbi:glycoside hydrolase family 79 protein [Seiridium cupressi]
MINIASIILLASTCAEVNNVCSTKFDVGMSSEEPHGQCVYSDLFRRNVRKIYPETNRLVERAPESALSRVLRKIFMADLLFPCGEIIFAVLAQLQFPVIPNPYTYKAQLFNSFIQALPRPREANGQLALDCSDPVLFVRKYIPAEGDEASSAFTVFIYWDMLSVIILAAGAAAVAAGLGDVTRINKTRTLNIPSSAPSGKQIVDANYQSYSIEFNYMLDFAGNNSAPNKYSIQLLQNLADISGAYPIIRAGGTTQNRATFVANQTQALIQKFSSSDADQPSSLTIGPTWVESFQQFPEGIKYIYGLNFYDGEVGLDQTVLEATSAFEGLGNSLYAFEIGNEVDGDTSGMTKTVADHDYMGSACEDTTKVATIEYNLLNHTHTTSIAYYHDYLGNVSAEAGMTYVLGETNSVSCQGLAGVSDVYAAALWSIDYVLYMSSLKVERVYFHMVTPYRYSAWQPVATNTSAAYVKPLYYGNLFTSTAFAGGNKQVSVLANDTSFTAYGIYDAANSGKLESVAIINLEVFNSTSSSSERPYTAVKLPGGCSNASIQRLTSPGVEIADNITFAGQSVRVTDGTIVGHKRVETVEENLVPVGAGEAILIIL